MSQAPRSPQGPPSGALVAALCSPTLQQGVVGNQLRLHVTVDLHAAVDLAGNSE